jgi:histone acetyltransferase (RNA polymerase elongator complex component)
MQARSRVDQLLKLGHVVDKVEITAKDRDLKMCTSI